MDHAIRDAIRQSGKTHYAIGKAARLAPSVIDRFMAGRDINLATAAKLARVLDLRLRYKDKA